MLKLYVPRRVNPMLPHEDGPEGYDPSEGSGGTGPLGESEPREGLDPRDYDPGEVDEVGPALQVIHNRIISILRHAHTDQGLLALDLMEVLHQAQGQVISWGMVEAWEDSDEYEDDEDDSGEECQEGGSLLPQEWTPESDLEDPEDDEDEDVDDQGDPRIEI